MQPFEGLRVVDLSPNRVGAQISQLFADFGADVIWVEPPGGAALRSHPAAAFWARGKKSVTLDLHDDHDRGVARALATSADVLVETFRPGVLAGLGLGYDDLAATNPRLVYCSVTGWGSQGPYARVKGYEGLVAAKLGIFQAFSRMTPGIEPPFVTAPWCSFSASQVALHGVLAALLERERSGVGQRVETSLAQAFSALDTWAWFEHLIEQKWPGGYFRMASFDEDGIPTTPFAYFLLIALTKDGRWLQFAQVAPHLFVALMKALGLDALFGDPKWSGMPKFDDRERRLELWELMLQAAGEKTLADWEAVFEADPNVFAELFRSGTNILEHPQLVHDGMVVEIADPERGPVRQPGPLVHLFETPAELGRPAPRAGEHQLPPEPAAVSRGAGAPIAAPAPRDLPLAGVTIVEFAVLFAAPHGTTLLTDLGARVIKVEPLEGDPIRNIITFPESGGAKVMQGKESICIDLGTTEGLRLAHQLVGRADVVMQGYRAGVAERMGLGYERLRALNPDLVYVNSPGYGLGDPNGHRPAYAPSIGAASGIGRTNVGDAVPEEPGLTMAEVRAASIRLNAAATYVNAQADGFAALGVATAIMLGLLARARGAGGQEALTTMLNTGAHAMSAQAVDYPGSPGEPSPDRELTGLGPLYRVYAAADGWVFLAAPADKEWAALAVALAPRVDLQGDGRFATAALRRQNADVLADVLAGVFSERGKADWERELTAADVGCVAVTTDSIEAVYWSEDFGRASGYLADVEHPTFGEHPRMAPLVRFSRSATQVKGGVLAGDHTDAVLAELGLSGDEIADLRERKIVG